MGCFSFICKECGHAVNSDSQRGEYVKLFLLKGGEVIEKMEGMYDSYGRVFDEAGKDTIKWSMDWGEVCDLMSANGDSSGIAAVHTSCWKGETPVSASKDDPNQGWGKIRRKHLPVEGDIGHYESLMAPLADALLEIRSLRDTEDSDDNS